MVVMTPASAIPARRSLLAACLVWGAAIFTLCVVPVCAQTPQPAGAVGASVSGDFFVRVWNEGHSSLRLYAGEPDAVNTVSPTQVGPYVPVQVHEETPTTLQVIVCAFPCC